MQNVTFIIQMSSRCLFKSLEWEVIVRQYTGTETQRAIIKSDRTIFNQTFYITAGVFPSLGYTADASQYFHENINMDGQ